MKRLDAQMEQKNKKSSMNIYKIPMIDIKLHAHKYATFSLPNSKWLVHQNNNNLKADPIVGSADSTIPYASFVQQ